MMRNAMPLFRRQWWTWCVMMTITAAAAEEKTEGSLVEARCQDNEHYKSRLGLSCKAHLSLNCAGFSAIGLTLQETEELLTQCPQSCRVSKCLDPSPAETAPTATTSGASSFPSRSQQIPEEQRRLQFDDFTCFDDPTYTSKIGFPCADHQTLDCRQLNMVGFTNYEVFELINSCPESCNIPCGTWTIGPTDAPTAKPSASRAPTESPTKSPEPTPAPSSSPSSAPSDAPTSKPSVTPSVVPSHEPSAEPTTFPSRAPLEAPSTTPSSLPSAGPSAMPSSFPTSVPSTPPSSEPSNAPSQPPSPVPSASPSEMPHDSPTVSPSHRPTMAPSHSPTPNPSDAPSSAPSMPTSFPSVEPTPGRKIMSTTISLPLEMQQGKASLVDSKDAEALQSVARSFLQENHAVTENVTIKVTSVKIVSHSVAMGPAVVAEADDGGGGKNQSTPALPLLTDPSIVEPTTVRLLISGEVRPWHPPKDFAFSTAMAHGFRSGFGDFLQELHNASTAFQPRVFHSPQEGSDNLEETPLSAPDNDDDDDDDDNNNNNKITDSLGGWNGTSPSLLGLLIVLGGMSLLVVVLSAICFSCLRKRRKSVQLGGNANGKKLDPSEENSIIPSGTSATQLLAAGATTSSTYAGGGVGGGGGEGEDSLPTMSNSSDSDRQPHQQQNHRSTFGAFVGPFQHLYRSRTQSTQGSNAIQDSLSGSYSQDWNEI